MLIELPRCNFKYCHYCFDGNCHKKTRDMCDYYYLKAENERLIDLVKELQGYNEAWVADSCELRTKNKNLAREIFGEIEKLHLHITNEFDSRRYEELKKKYTEVEE